MALSSTNSSNSTAAAHSSQQHRQLPPEASRLAAEPENWAMKEATHEGHPNSAQQNDNLWKCRFHVALTALNCPDFEPTMMNPTI